MKYRTIRMNTKKALRFLNQHTIDVIVIAIIICQWTISSKTLAFTMQKSPDIASTKQRVNKEENTLPKEILDVFQVVYKKKITITAYSSTPDQTDSTPCITANGFNLCKHNEENIIAANFLPFGTKIRIPEHFGEKIFIVQDRMNARYHYRADIWMKTRRGAVVFGSKYTEIEVLK